MNKLYIASIYLSLGLGWGLAQEQDPAHHLLHQRELKAYSALRDYNVNPNTENYDLRRMDLDLTVDPAKYYISGKATPSFIPSSSLQQIVFDAKSDLQVSAVRFQGHSLNFSQTQEELLITFSSPLAAGTLYSLEIDFAGVPNGSHGAFTTSTDTQGNPVLFTLSEPYGAKDWWVTKQSLTDKIEQMHIRITTPAEYKVASNGVLVSETLVGNNQKQTYWRMDYPMPAYLFSLAIAKYVVSDSMIGLEPQFPFKNYLYPATSTNSTILANIENTKPTMVTLEKNFGPYPFRQAKYGHAEFLWGGGMEHSTISSMGAWGKSIIAHELGHQWFGDKVTCARWNDIWINEGFATFAEHLYAEKHTYAGNPQGFVDTYLRGQIRNITSAPGGSVYVADADLGNDGIVFSSRLSYAKGGYLLRMIKWILGEDRFYSTLQAFHDDPRYAYKYATGDNFRDFLKEKTGVDFTEFFRDWYYGQGYPTYAIRWGQAADNSLQVVVNQTTSHPSVPFFEMPLPIRVTGTAGQVQDLVLQHTSNGQAFVQPIPFRVASVSFNSEAQILTPVSTPIQDITLATQEVRRIQEGVYRQGQSLFVKGTENNHQPYQILDASGRTVLQGTYSSSAGISVQQLQPGMYVLKIGTLHHKFVQK